MYIYLDWFTWWIKQLQFATVYDGPVMFNSDQVGR